MATAHELVHFRFLILFDVRAQPLTRLLAVHHHDLLPVVIFELERRLRYSELVELPILLLTGQYALVEELVVLSRIKSVVLNVRVVRLVILVFYRFKLFLLVDCLIVVYENRVDLVSLKLLILNRSSDYLPKPHPQVVEFVILEVLGVVDKR